MSNEELKLAEHVLEAYNLIKDGVVKRIDINGQIKMYACKNVIRMDIAAPGVSG